MTIHIHLLATPGAPDSISKVFRPVGRKSVQYFNFNNKRSATLREGGNRATVVDSERYLLTVMRYIELNPVRAGMVAHPRDYPWSSYAHNAGGESGKNVDWLVPQREYLRLGRTDQDRQEAYRQLFKAAASKDDLTAIRDSTHKGWALGSQRFIHKIEALGQRRASSWSVGRPKTTGNNRV